MFFLKQLRQGATIANFFQDLFCWYLEKNSDLELNFNVDNFVVGGGPLLDADWMSFVCFGRNSRTITT